MPNPKRLQKIRKPTPIARVKQRPGFFQRNRKRALAAGLAGGIALGSVAGVKGFQAFRFAKWRQNTSLTFTLGTHLHRTDAVPIANALDKARVQGRPFDFLVLENAGILKGERKEQERIFNKHCNELRKRFAKELSQNNITPAIELLRKKGAFRGDPDQAECMSAIISYAAKHGLRIKLGEEYSKRDFKKSEDLGAKFVQLMGEIKENLPTSVVLEKARQAMIAEEEYVSFRNNAFAKVTANSAAELRRDFPELRGKELKGIVQAGLGHFGVVEEVQRKGVKNLKVDSVIDLAGERLSRFSQGSRIPASFPALDLITTLKAKGFKTTPEQVALSFLTEPIYKGAISSGNAIQAAWIGEQVLKQTPQSATQVLKQVWSLRGKERVAKMMELMSGQKH